MHVLVIRLPSKLERLIQKTAHDLMQLLKLLLGIQKSLRDRVSEELLPERFELRDFLLFQFHPVALLHLEQITQIVHLLVLKLQVLIGHEGIQLLLYDLKIVLIHDRLAEVDRALNNTAFFDVGVHESRRG